MEKEIVINGELGKISGILERGFAGKRIVLLIHGFASGKNNKTNRLLRDYLNKVCFDSIRIDLYNHGESEGSFEDMALDKCILTIKSTVDYFLKKGYKEIGIIASSMGGLSSLIFCQEYPNKVDFLILKSPPVFNQGNVIADYYHINLKSWKNKGFYEWKNEAGFRRRLNYNFYFNAQGYNALKKAKKISMPLLIFHGSNDDFVPISGSKTLVKLADNAELFVIDGADHFFGLSQTKKMIKHIDKFLRGIWNS